MPSNPSEAHRAIARFAESHPQSPALIDPDGATLTYKEFWEQIETVSRRLEEAGFAPGERVAVLLPQGPIQVLAVTGVMNHHAVQPLSTRETTADSLYFLRRVGARVLIIAPEFEPEIEGALAMGLAVLVAREGEALDRWQLRVPQFPLEAHPAPSGVKAFFNTSGTTGGTKTVPYSVTGINAAIDSIHNWFQLTASDRLLLLIPQHLGVSVVYALAQFSIGGAVIAIRGFEPSAFVGWLDELRPTYYICAPTVHQAALAQFRSTPPRRPISLRFVETGFAFMPTELLNDLEQTFGVPVLISYGSNEAMNIAKEPLFPHHRVPRSVGRSCGPEIAIMDSSGALLSTGGEGEIVVRGATVFSGYVDNPQATQAAFRDGWYKTGDVGRLDENGNLFVTGRLKEMINRGGEKVAPDEVDAAIAAHPAVLEAVAFAVPHPTLGEDVACAVVLREGNEGQVSARELRRFAATQLTPFKVPRHIYFLDQMPRGELGKPQRGLLADRLEFARSVPPSPAEVSERDSSGRLFEGLHEIWVRILDCPDLGYNEDFFEAGGDSLAALNMLTEVDQRFGCQTSDWAASFLDEPTLEHLMSLVGEPSPPRSTRNDPNNMQVFPVGKGGSGVNLFCLPTEGNEGLNFRRLATHLDGKMDLQIVRPASTFHRLELFGLEHEGREAAEVIRRAQPEGPYFVSGYCYGGMVAVEAALQLSNEGQDVNLILFEAPMPGFPRLLFDWPVWVKRARWLWHRIWNTEHPGARRDLQFLSKRVAGGALNPFRRLLVPFEQTSAVQWLLEWLQSGFVLFYNPRPLNAPILHFLCENEPRMIWAYSRFGWRRIARRGIEEHIMPLDHYNILHESNLPRTVEILLKWCGIQPEESRVGAKPPVRETMKVAGVGEGARQ
jgi:oxalate---CoA ligase